MQRYFIDQNLISENEIIIEGNDHHHMKRVMRFNVGDQIIVNTYQGQSYLCEITEFNRDSVVLNIVESLDVEPLKYHLDLGLVLTKKDAFELALKKATELGVSGIFPLMSKHSIIKVKDFDKKKERYFTICKESAEQSERVSIPHIGDLLNLEDVQKSDYDHLFFAYARGKHHHLRDAFKHIKPEDKTLVLIGPEGGFSETEFTLLKAKGFHAISLGETILRADTAAIFVASAYRLMMGGIS